MHARDDSPGPSFPTWETSLLLTRFNAFSGAQKSDCLWYNFNSVESTLSIRNFNNLKSLDSTLKRARVETRFPAEIQRSAAQLSGKNRDIFAEWNGH
jgi:hypothetical protein